MIVPHYGGSERVWKFERQPMTINLMRVIALLLAALCMPLRHRSPLSNLPSYKPSLCMLVVVLTVVVVFGTVLLLAPLSVLL